MLLLFAKCLVVYHFGHSIVHAEIGWLREFFNFLLLRISKAILYLRKAQMFRE